MVMASERIDLIMAERMLRSETRPGLCKDI